MHFQDYFRSCKPEGTKNLRIWVYFSPLPKSALENVSGLHQVGIFWQADEPLWTTVNDWVAGKKISSSDDVVVTQNVG